jgi:hypothetical protein
MISPHVENRPSVRRCDIDRSGSLRIDSLSVASSTSSRFHSVIVLCVRENEVQESAAQRSEEHQKRRPGLRNVSSGFEKAWDDPEGALHLIIEPLELWHGLGSFD